MMRQVHKKSSLLLVLLTLSALSPYFIIGIFPTHVSIPLGQEKQAISWCCPSSLRFLFFPIPAAGRIGLGLLVLLLCQPRPSPRAPVTPELRRCARVDARNARQETALGVLCGQAPARDDHSLQLFQLLLAHGADVEARDESWRRPLHRACGAANAELVRLLLRRGADANAIDYDGVSPLGWALQAAASRPELRPHLTVQLLLNHGSQRIWPSAFSKVLKSCAAVPEVIEVLFNSYSQIPVSQEWAEAVPREVFQQHQAFYESLLGLAGTARSLQHLCRATIRAHLGDKCHCLIPLLPLPRGLQEFLLLEPQGVVL